MPPRVVVIGPRQCGKTTLLKSLPKDWRIFDLERQSDREIIERDPDLFLRLNPGNVAIDEVQFLPSIFTALRVAIDADRSARGRFVLTGSSSPFLLKAVSESLAGRIGLLDLVLDADFGLVPIEIKYSGGVDHRRGVSGLESFMNDFDCRLGIIVTNGDKPLLLSDRIVIVPFSYL